MDKVVIEVPKGQVAKVNKQADGNVLVTFENVEYWKFIKDVNPMSDEKYLELEVGKEYIVEDISMGQSLTYVQLEGVNNFINSICLDFYENGKELNNDKRFNPYLR